MKKILGSRIIIHLKALSLILTAIILLVVMTSGTVFAAKNGDECGPNDPLPQPGWVCGNCRAQGCVWTTNTNGPQAPVKLKDNPIVDDINVVVNFLSIGVGVVVVAMIIIGGIQYSAAGDNPQALTAAKQRITNALIALFAFFFIFAFLQWLIPGGVF